MKPILLDWIGFKVFSYPLLMGIAWGVSYQLSLYILRKKKIAMAGFQGLFWGTLAFSWIGAKLLFLLTSHYELYPLLITNSNFWTGGGFVFFGGLIGGILYCLIYTLILKKFSFKELYLFIPSLALGHGIGRIGCFLAGCCFGTQCNLPWSIYLHKAHRHPVQLYESGALIVLGITSYYFLAQRTLRARELTLFYLFSYSVVRFTLEFFRGDKVRGIFWQNLSTSQLISLGILLLVGSYLLFEFILQKYFQKK